MGDIEKFDIADNSDWTPIQSMIKVIGVGGGGCNAVNYMFRENVEGCSFMVCNTDRQALEESPVPIKIHIGRNALGAGTDPTKGRNAALEAQEQIEKVVLNEGTQMLFITAGMGGGTGTGAAPQIAKMAKDKGILTVAVVTIPFENEGDMALSRAIDGIHELVKNVDSLLIINNEKLYDYFGGLLIHDAFPKADEVLATAVRGITEIISKPGYINVDFEDIKTMMKNSGMALMGCGIGSGENRIEEAVQGALHSPLLNDFDLTTAKNLLVNITCGKNENGLTMDDLKEINAKIADYTGNVVNKFKTGLVWETDPEIGDKVKITAIATGFKVNDLSKITKTDLGNLIIIGKDFKFEKKRLGLGKANIIYVKNFMLREEVEKYPEKPVNTQKSKNHTSGSPKNILQEVQNIDFKKSKKQTSRSPEIISQEVQESDCNNTDSNKTVEIGKHIAKSYRTIEALYT